MSRHPPSSPAILESPEYFRHAIRVAGADARGPPAHSRTPRALVRVWPPALRRKTEPLDLRLAGIPSGCAFNSEDVSLVARAAACRVAGLGVHRRRRGSRSRPSEGRRRCPCPRAAYAGRGPRSRLAPMRRHRPLRPSRAIAAPSRRRRPGSGCWAGRRGWPRPGLRARPRCGTAPSPGRWPLSRPRCSCS